MSPLVKFRYEYMVPMQEKKKLNQKPSLENAVLLGEGLALPPYRRSLAHHLSRYCQADSHRKVLLNPGHAHQKWTTSSQQHSDSLPLASPRPDGLPPQEAFRHPC